VTIALLMEAVVKTYPASGEVLRGVNLSIAHGEATAIVGPSGAGKSTLLQVMSTLDRPTAGRVRVLGAEVDQLDDRQLAALRAWKIGFVFQQFFLLEPLSATENAAQGLLYRGLPRAERLTRAREILERVGLQDRADHPVAQLSGGERQRVAIARALIGRPELLFADEPTGNLDSSTGRKVLELFRELGDETGATLVLITHDPEIARSLPRRVRLQDGRILGTAA
jgi:putative ABC transport system ATP-binding protein